jgi:hypothetical protein
MRQQHSNRLGLGFLGLFLFLSCVNSFQPANRILSNRRQEPATWRSGRPDENRVTSSLSSTTESASSASTESNISTDYNNKKRNNKDERLAMPWSDSQDSALHDNLSKYTVHIPLRKADSGDKGEEESQIYCLWRTMLKEVPQIAGYPIDFLQTMHGRQIQNNETLLKVTPGLLPYLEDYEFTSAGGVAGKVYGIAGIADGTRIETSAVSHIEVTLPQGFVRTTDGSAAYEVGRPKREEFSSDAVSASALAKGGGELWKNVQNGGSLEPMTVEGGDGMLMRLGASSAILLAGATAVSMLSHHLTLNVFWV